MAEEAALLHRVVAIRGDRNGRSAGQGGREGDDDDRQNSRQHGNSLAYRSGRHAGQLERHPTGWRYRGCVAALRACIVGIAAAGTQRDTDDTKRLPTEMRATQSTDTVAGPERSAAREAMAISADPVLPDSDEAALAAENARLVTELRQALEYQAR